MHSLDINKKETQEATNQLTYCRNVVILPVTVLTSQWPSVLFFWYYLSRF